MAPQRRLALCFFAAFFYSAVFCFADSTNQQAWWSLQPLRRSALPASSRTTPTARNPIDQFIGFELRKNHLSASPIADRRTLLRRISFDLAGLPPTPEEVTGFEKDKSPDAWEKVVDRLLASPRYGERWARHWLDVVRFAETHGFEMNQPRPTAWPYRDYVIRALNEDKPYDRFVIEQVAGDVFGVDEATGFLVGGPWDQVKSPDPVLTANQRADELHDMVSVTASTFLGLTVGCARCHNHKFDPIPQTDYYAMKAVFEGVKHGERKLRTPESEEREKELATKRARLATVETELESFEPFAEPATTNALRAPVNARKNIERFAPVAARRLRFTVAKTTDAEPCIDELEVYTAEDTPRNIALVANGTKATASSVFPNSDIHRLEHINDGKYGNSRSWISNERGKGWVELEFPQTVTIDKVVWGRDREEKFFDRLATEYQIEVAGSNDWRVVASSADRQAHEAGKKVEPKLITAGLSSDGADRAAKLFAERTELQKRVAELSKASMAYSGEFEARPESTYRLFRGDPMQKREEIMPAALSAVSVKLQLDCAADAVGKSPADLTENQSRRLALAEWIVDPANPLTARVMVNRIWQYHFGQGLVSTPSDFGANGARPTHPELLDWLATEFIEHGWSIKHVHRLIVTSATYRQASGVRKDCMAVDTSTKLLWRFPPRRMEAEAIRDSILATSGKLDLAMGGPGYSFFEANDNYVRVYNPRREWPPETFRRMVYGTIVRQRPDGVFGVFDCPDAGQIAPKRSASTTPLQALNLLNSSFMMQQAEFFAKRLQNEAGSDAKIQVRRAFALAFQRKPDRAEIAAATKLIQSDGLHVFCRALLNANEFLYVF
jgi:hypothetical protein